MTLSLRQKVTTYVVVGFFAFVLAFPFYWMLTTALKPIGDLLNVQNLPFWFHPGPTLENFQNLFDTNYPRWLANTAIVGVAVVAITLALALPAGYALARLSGRIGGTLGIAIFSTIAAGSGAILGPHAAAGISDAFLVGALLATLASVVAYAVLPQSRHFLPKLHLSPHAMPIH